MRQQSGWEEVSKAAVCDMHVCTRLALWVLASQPVAMPVLGVTAFIRSPARDCVWNSFHTLASYLNS